MFRKLLLTCAASVLALAGIAGAQDATISGPILTKTWDMSMSPIHVVGPCTVMVADTLTINAGVEVYFDADVQFVVEGVLEVWGNDVDGVLFAPGLAAEWGGLRFSGGDTSRIEGAYITGGHAKGVWPNESGGGIAVGGAGTHVELRHSLVSGNTADSDGGGVYAYDYASVRLEKCKVEYNTAALSGGGVAASTSGVEMIRCVVVGNSASSFHGGGVYFAGPAALSLTNCTVSGNSSTDSGALYVENADANLSNTILWGNSPQEILVATGSVAATYSDIQGGWGVAEDMKIDADPLFIDPANGDYSLAPESPCIDAGDPASPYDPDGTVADMGAIPHNVCVDCPGPGTDISGPIFTTMWDMAGSPYHVVGPCTVKVGNTLTINGGVEVQFDVDVPFVVEGAIETWGNDMDQIRFMPGAAPQWGGIRISGGAYNTMSWTEINGGNAVNGGAISVIGSDLDLVSAMIHHNNASSGGGVHVSGLSNVNMDHSVIAANTAGYGAGIYVYNTGAGSVTLTNCTLNQNNASTEGGALYANTATVTLLNTIAWGNPASFSGEIKNLSSTVTATYSDIMGGWGIAEDMNIDADPMFVDPMNGDFSLSAGSPCIDAGDPASPPDPDGTAADMGAIVGGVCIDCGPGPGTEIAGAIFTETWDMSMSPIHVVGPCTVMVADTLYINPGVEVLFDVDVPFVVEGALEAWGNDMDKIRFVPGMSPEWGGIRVSGGQSSSISWAKITGGNANGGGVDDHGGGIHVSGAGTNLNLEHVGIRGNAATGDGGGIAVIESATLQAYRCNIAQNVGGGHGGGVWVMGGAAASLTNCTIADNHTGVVAGGGAYVNAGGSLDLLNCIVWGNSPGALVNDGADPGSISVWHSDIQGGWGVAEDMNIDADPMFADPAMGDYHLTPGSPCINAGDPASPYDPDGSVADMGAFWFECYDCQPPAPALMVETFTFPQPQTPSAVAMRPGGPIVAVGGSGGKVYIWDFDLGPEPAIVDSYATGGATPMQVNALEYTPDGAVLVAGSQDGNVYAWDAAGTQLWASLASEGGVNDLAMNPAGGNFAVCGPGMMSIHTLDGETQVTPPMTLPTDISSLAYDASGTRVLGGGNDGAVYAWDVGTGELLWRSQLHEMGVVAVDVVRPGAYGMDGEWGISADNTGTVMGWNLMDGMYEGQLPPGDPVGALQIAPSGGHFVIGTAAAAAMPNGVDIWNAGGQGEPMILASPRPHMDAVSDMDLSPQGDVIVTTSWDGSLALYFVEPWLQPPPPHEYLSFTTDTHGPSDMYVEIGNPFTLPIQGTIVEAQNVDIAFFFNGLSIGVNENEAPWDSLVISTAFDAAPDGQVFVNVIGDTVLVTMASSAPITIVDGLICELSFIGGPEQSESIVNWKWEATNVNERNIDLQDGYIFVLPPPPPFGDVTNDGSITAFDASTILQYVVKLTLEIPFEIADVTDNGQVTGYDAALVLVKIVNPDFVFPARMNWGGGMVKPAPSGPVALEWRRVDGAWSLIASDLTGPIGADLTLRLPEGATVSGSGAIASSRVGDVVTVSVANIGDVAELIRVDGMLTAPEIMSGTINEREIVTARPLGFALQQNAPNPFNPSTTIAFSLPETGRATLGVYSITGQLVRSLIDADMVAGTHEIVWDGRDAYGRNVASGVYLYRLSTASHTAVRRLALVR